MKPPPSELLPPGATGWALVNDVAIRIGKEVKTVRRACERGLFHSTSLAGGYFGTWVAVREGGWPVDGPKVGAYRAHRSERAKIGQRVASAAAVAAKKRKRTEPPSKAKKRCRSRLGHQR